MHKKCLITAEFVKFYFLGEYNVLFIYWVMFIKIQIFVVLIPSLPFPFIEEILGILQTRFIANYTGGQQSVSLLKKQR